MRKNEKDFGHVHYVQWIPLLTLCGLVDADTLSDLEKAPWSGNATCPACLEIRRLALAQPGVRLTEEQMEAARSLGVGDEIDLNKWETV